MSIAMKTWTQQQVLDWFEQQRGRLGDKIINQIKARCKEYETTGQDLHGCKHKSDVASAFDFLNPLKAGTVYWMIKQRSLQDLQIPFPQQNVNVQSENTQFVLNMSAKTRRFKLKDTVTANTKIIRVTQMYYEQEVNVVSQEKLKDVRLISNGVPLDSNKTLKDYGITNDNNLVTVLFTSYGGTTATASLQYLNEFRERKLNFQKFPFLERTERADCITLEHEDDTALMPCGHAIAPDTMYMYIKSIFDKNENVIEIRCPVPKCAVKWDWKLVTSVADMNSDEYVKFTAIRDRRLAATRDEKDCPHCGATCKRKDGVVIFRMRCVECSNSSDWCWECGKPWDRSGLFICGNTSCKVINDINSALAKCKTIDQAVVDKEHAYLGSNSKFLGPCPSIRACPNCFTLMNHKDKCKHMRCASCLEYFCWYCLVVRKENGQYDDGCVGAYDACKNGKHARQHIK